VNLACNNLTPAGTASNSCSQLSIATKEPEGALWYTGRAVRLYPVFEWFTSVKIPDDGCWDIFGSWAFDGFTMIMTKTKPPFLNGGGGAMGYFNLYNGIVLEVDLYYNSEAGDLSENSISLHKCYNSYCTYFENANTIQRNLPIVILV
jgi:hypothetical protein